MAHKVIVTNLLDGPKKAIIHVYLESDGISGELSNFVLADLKTDFFDSPLNTKMSITQVWTSCSWFDAILKFGAVDENNQEVWQLTRDSANYHDLRYFGGITDKSTLDGTGQVLISTNGFTNLGSTGTMVIEIQKNK